MRNVDDEIKLEIVESVGHIVIDRPPHNFTDLKLLRQLADQIDSCRELKLRSILLSSTGKNFCAGADFSTGGVGSEDHSDDIEPSKKFEKDTNAFYYQALRILSCDLPIVCLVQGAAVGAGLGLALAADYRIGTENAKFVAPFVKLGIHPGFGLTYLLPKLVGHANATDMLLTGRRVGAKEGLEMGLLNKIVEEKDISDVGLKIAKQIADNAPLAVAATKKTLNYQTVKKVQKILIHELSCQVELISTKDAAIGIEASLNRTVPEFIGE